MQQDLAKHQREEEKARSVAERTPKEHIFNKGNLDG
jgi:hypothetical protein